ncbi:MAG: YkgJ family cysteine cluster protein [Deltaproteobacteria bacterium]|nr:YkgJ family cysteine cluster protein [Deltaproteobacteria bacterium]
MGGNATPPGATLQALDDLWDHHRSKWRRLFSARAITELTLRASFDLDLLAPARIANRVPRGTIPDCERCQDICCAGVENVISLRLRDIALLIDIGKAGLIRKQKPRFPEHLLRTRPMLQELVASELFRTLPVLEQVGEDRRCAALSEDLRCSLHPHWPLSCERFPYSLSAIRRQVIWGTRCQSKRSGPEHVERGDALFRAAVETFNERVRDAVLLAHARPTLDALGIGAFLTGPDEDPFEESAAPGSRLPIVD